MKCPKCGKWSWQKKVLTQEDFANDNSEVAQNQTTFDNVNNRAEPLLKCIGDRSYFILQV